MLALRRLPPFRAGALIERIVSANAGAAISPCAGLLARASAALDEFDMRSAAAALVAALPGDPAQKVELPVWQRPQPVEPQLVVDTLAALSRIDSASADKAAGIFLGWPEAYDADRVLIPAGLALSQLTVADAPAVARLRAACVAHLRARIAEPLAPPADWARDSQLTCKCMHCTELGRFLTDPARKTWNFKAVHHERGHVESTIRSSNCDLAIATIRRGSPHTLECTKTQASYERRTRQRQTDLEYLAGFEAYRLA
jgi:hypothetical protein